MSSNTKPNPPAKESPTEPFKRAVVGCMRAIANQPDLEVSFAADRPILSGHKARLPEPPRKMTARDVAITRGIGDSLALRLACHDPSVHRAHAPTIEGGPARRLIPVKRALPGVPTMPAWIRNRRSTTTRSCASSRS